MKKFYAFFAAMLISICSFASKDVVPSDAVLADYYDQGNVCVCIYVPADMACNDIVLTGMFNNWSTKVNECARFEAVEGYDGWYVASFEPEAEPEVGKGIQAKPVMLDFDGNFNWEYQAFQATVIRGGVQVVVGGYYGEIDLINYGTDAPNVMTIDAWKTNPCTAIYHNYTVTVISDGCNGYAVPYIVGAMTNWDFTQMQLDSDASLASGVPVYTYSFKAAEGTPYQLVSGLMDGNGTIIVLPAWDDEAYLQKQVNGAWVRMPGDDDANLLTHEEPNIVFDLRDEDLRWARCEPEEYTIVAVNLPSLHAPESVDIIGNFDNWQGTPMELLETGWWFVQLNVKASQDFKFRSGGSWDQEIEFYDSENDVWRAISDKQLIFGQLWSDDTWKGTPCKWIELDLSDPEYFRWSGDFPPEEYNVSLSGFTYGYISNYGYIYDNWSGKLPTNTNIYLECNPGYGYRFTKWSDGNTDNPRSIVVTQDINISAEVEQYIFNGVKIGDLYYDLNSETKTAAVVGTTSSSGGTSMVSVTYHSIAEWNSLPQEYVAEAICPADAVYSGLKSVKVYADPTYINILVEPDMNVLPDLEYVPFHVYIDTDNSDATGGCSDMFTDANTDILLEGAVFSNYNPCSYNPFVFKWWGEVGGSGWEWTDPYTDHDESDCWGAIICEGALYDCASQFVDGKFEFKINRTNIPATWSNSVLGIGVEIQQSWSTAGILPCVSPSEENPSGIAAKLKVKIDKNAPTSEETSDLNPNLVIPATVSYKGINYDVTTISYNAFANHKELTSVEIPTSMTYIEYNAFEGCENITSVVWNAKNCNGYHFGTQVESFVFGNEVESIPEQICYRMSKLTAITIPASVKYIGSMAFAYTGLTAVEIPDNVTNGGYDFFYGCEKLISYKGPASMCYGMYYLQKIVITSGTVTGIGYNSNLTYLDIAACDNTTLWEYAFSGYYSLKQLILPKKLQSIEYMAIAECLNLEEIAIPAAVATIGDRSFENCRSLRAVTFEGSALTTIGDWAFYNCHELRSIEIPEGVTSVGKAAFYGCAYLTEVTLPASMQALGDNAFALCALMQKLNVNAVVPPTIEDKTFEQVSLDMPVYVPEVSVPAYKADRYWGRMNIIGAETAVDAINSDAAAIRKQMIDGQLFILRDGKTYTIQGLQVR